MTPSSNGPPPDDLVLAAFLDLNEARRRTLVLAIDAGLSYREIADLLGAAPQEIAGMINDALRAVREKLDGRSRARIRRPATIDQ